MVSAPIVYDVGLNNGDDTEYYLRKGYGVVAIEANPLLCRAAELRFAKEIAEGRCVILNIGVAEEPGILNFFLNTRDSITSTFVPQRNDDGRYEVMPMRVERLSQIIRQYGEPHFVKIDVEGMDFIVLRELFRAGQRPFGISAEAHSIDVFCVLVSMGYDEFRLVQSGEVSRTFANHEIRLLDGRLERFAFQHNSSGPFGEDLPGPWLTKEALMVQLCGRAETWQDIHARNARATYLKAAEQPDSPVSRQDVELAYAYWRRYPDVAQHALYGEHGELGIDGPRQHFDRHGRHEEKRRWGLD